MAQVLVLGTNGMLGSMVARVLKESGHTVSGTNRTGSDGNHQFEVGRESIESLIGSHPSVDYIVNAIGIIKPRIDEAQNKSRFAAIQINGIFPHHLASVAEKENIHIIQIATDCVYSGKTGLYVENSSHDPIDVYGKTKSLGEVPSPNVLHLRASIIGPEQGRQTSLWEWVKNQEENASLNGFINHRWNGISTYHFGRICDGIISHNLKFSGIQHVVPKDIVTKSELVTAIAIASKRPDLNVVDTTAAESIDRTLSTNFPDLNNLLWDKAGYKTPPSVVDMVYETPLD